MSLPKFQQDQYRFAAHLRDPKANPAPTDVEDRRMEIYRELFYNNVEGLLTSTFPVVKKVLGETDWHALVRHYFANHIAHTPIFPEMAEEFLQYLQEGRSSAPEADNDPAFLLELAHYEWVELALQIAEADIDDRAAIRGGDLISGMPVVSPVAWTLQYQFPVHNISPEVKPQIAPDAPTFLVVYRNRDDDVRFMEINGVTARLLSLLAEGEVSSGEAALLQIAQELGQSDTDAIINFGREMMMGLLARDILLGVQPE